MATLNIVKKGQTVTEQIDIINENVQNVNTELVNLHSDVSNNVAGYITSAEAPVQSVNSKTGYVSLNANDVGAFPNSSTVTALDINNLKDTGVYIGTYDNNAYNLIVIKYSDNNIYQELIGSNSKKYRRFTTSWSDWVQYFSDERPVTASDVTGINTYDSNTVLDVALLNNGTFVKTNLKYNASTGSLWYGANEFATKTYVDNAVNMIHSIIVNELPAVGVENTIYYVPDTTPETGNAYLEYVYVNGAWELVGATEVDLTPFLTKTEASQTYATKLENDGKVSKTTTINGKALSSNINLTASDVGALPSDTPIPADLVHRYDNATIASMLSNGNFTNGDLIIVTDVGTYTKGHIYLYNSGLVDITDIPNDYVDLSSNQSVGGTKNFTGILRYGGVSVATTDDISTVEGMIPTVNDSTITIQKNGTTVDSFTLNQSSNKSINIATPTKTSDLTNDGDGTSNFATESYVATNGGKIDTISVNGTPQTITNKNVDITVPTSTRELTNNGNDGTSPYATQSYVNTNGGKIDTISVNGVQQTISNKNVNISVPVKTSDITNDGDGTYAFAVRGIARLV